MTKKKKKRKNDDSSVMIKDSQISPRTSISEAVEAEDMHICKDLMKNSQLSSKFQKICRGRS